MSDVQEAAQLLGGEDFPRIFLKTILQGLEVDNLALVNLTPWEG
jgi:hypothetical protein